MDNTDLILEVERLQNEISILVTDLELSKSDCKALEFDKSTLNAEIRMLKSHIKELTNKNRDSQMLIGELLYDIRQAKSNLSIFKTVSLLIIPILFLLIIWAS